MEWKRGRESGRGQELCSSTELQRDEGIFLSNSLFHFSSLLQDVDCHGGRGKEKKDKKIEENEKKNKKN